MQVAEHSTPSSLSKKKKSESVGSRGDKAKCCTASDTAARRGPHALVSPSLVSSWALVPGTGHLCGVLLQCKPVKWTCIFRLRPTLQAGTFLPPVGQKRVTCPLQKLESVPVYHVTQWGVDGFPGKGGVLTPGKGQAPGRQQNPWYRGIKTQMGLLGASFHLPKACVLL